MDTLRIQRVLRKVRKFTKCYVYKEIRILVG